VGQTIKSLEQRWRQHSRSDSNCDLLLRAINKYGKENFRIEIIKECSTESELNSEEVRLIKELNSLAPYGYNLMTGGAAPKHSDITKEKMSQTRKGKHPDWATQASTSEEARKKRSQSHLKLGSSVWTEERRNNAKKGAQERAIAVMDNFGIEYPSISEAARLTGCQNESVRLIVLRKQKKTKNKDGIVYTFRVI
jgi:group I intron endonuclease